MNQLSYDQCSYKEEVTDCKDNDEKSRCTLYQNTFNYIQGGFISEIKDEKEEIIEFLFKEVETSPGFSLKVDLERQLITPVTGNDIPFEVDGFRKHCLINGLDDIALTLESSKTIEEFEKGWKERSPWYFSPTA